MGATATIDRVIRCRIVGDPVAMLATILHNKISIPPKIVKKDDLNLIERF